MTIWEYMIASNWFIFTSCYGSVGNENMFYIGILVAIPFKTFCHNLQLVENGQFMVVVVEEEGMRFVYCLSKTGDQR